MKARLASVGALALAACSGGPVADGVAPEIVAVEVTPAISGPAGTVRATFETSEPLSDVQVALLTGAQARDLTLVEGEGTSWSFSVQLSGDEPEGEAAVVAQLTDTSGTVAPDVGLGAVVLDYSGPELLGTELGTSQYVRQGSRGVITVLASEGLTPASRVTFVAPGSDLDGVALEPSDTSGALPTWGYGVVGDEPEGPSQIQLALIDAAGNETEAGPIAAFVFDFTPPELDDGVPTTVTPDEASLAAEDLVTATFTASEPLARVDATLRQQGGDDSTPMAASSDDGGVSWTLERHVGAHLPFVPGFWEVEVRLRDRAGHELALALGAVELVD